jgi:hypothetical protein
MDEDRVELVQRVLVRTVLVDRIDLDVDGEAGALEQALVLELTADGPAILFKPAATQVVGMLRRYAASPVVRFQDTGDAEALMGLGLGSRLGSGVGALLTNSNI